MKTIKLTKNKYAKVDDQDFTRLNEFKWRAFPIHGARGEYYAARTGKDETRSNILMHTEITGYTKTDHIDCDGLNNQRANLREATESQNQGNRRKQTKPTSSKYKGVTWHKRNNVWRAQIQHGGKHRHLGCFVVEEEAAAAYDKAATDVFGAFARLNLPTSPSRVCAVA